MSDINLSFKDFNNGSNLKFSDISSETYREYVYKEKEDITIIKIINPVALNVNPISGGHRVWDANGVSHYIKPGWKEIRWEVKKGEPNFVL